MQNKQNKDLKIINTDCQNETINELEKLYDNNY